MRLSIESTDTVLSVFLSTLPANPWPSCKEGVHGTHTPTSLFSLLSISHPYSPLDFPGAQKVKSPAAMQETQVQSLGWKDPVEKEMATHSSILAWTIPWTEESVHGVAKSQTQLSDCFTHTHSPLARSPRARGPTDTAYTDKPAGE